MLRPTATVRPHLPPKVVASSERKLVARSLASAPALAPRGIPDVPAIIRAHPDPVARNEAFNHAYQQLGAGIQEAVDPGFSFRGPRAGVYPNWFGVGAHASPQVGRAMVAAERTLQAVRLLQGSPHLHGRDETFAALKLGGGDLRLANGVAKALEAAGVDSSVATALACAATLVTASDRATATSGVARDPRLAVATAWRLWNLVKPEGRGVIGTVVDAVRGLFGGNAAARESAVLERVAALCRTYRSVLADGNRAIFEDIGASGAQFLQLREQHGGRVTPETVLRELSLPQSSAGGARRVYEHALRTFDQSPPPTDFRQFTSEGIGNDVVRAAFALYTLAGSTAELSRKNALVAHANNLVAWREQFEAVQPAFEGQRPGELERAEVMAAMTPVVQVDVGGRLWTFDAFARRGGDRDGNPFTAPASEYDWSRFEDRWPAILDAFRFTFERPDTAWRFPDPRVR